MDERLSAFLEKVLKIVPEHFVTATELSTLYDRMYPPPLIYRAFGKMRSSAFKEKEAPRKLTDLSFPINYLARNGFIDHKISEYIEENVVVETSVYMMGDLGRSYLLSLKSVKKG